MQKKEEEEVQQPPKQKQKLRKRISESFVNVFKSLNRPSKGKKDKDDEDEETKEDQFIQLDPAQDLMTFEYLYSSFKSINESSVKKCIECIKIMLHEPVDTRKIVNVIQVSIEDEVQSLRGIIWRILMGQLLATTIFSYLPPSRKQWITIFEKNQQNYKQLIEENILSKIKIKKNQQNQQIEKKEIVNDHPLSKSKESQWNLYFEDYNLWSKIEKDTKRTRQKDNFFLQINNNKFYQNDKDSTIAVLSRNRANEKEYHFDALTRILFLYSKLNDGTYVQGMNEIAALIYYCFCNDNSEFLKLQAETDTFFCFTILMSEMKENFAQQTQQVNVLENNVFLKERIRVFADLLKKVDLKLFEHLIKQQVDFKYFSIKWLIPSLAQEFLILDTLKIWDSIISQSDSQSKKDFVIYLCISILLQMREELMKSEFGDIIMRLQNLEKQSLDINKIISSAYLLQKQYRK